MITAVRLLSFRESFSKRTVLTDQNQQHEKHYSKCWLIKPPYPTKIYLRSSLDVVLTGPDFLHKSTTLPYYIRRV